MYSNPVNFSIIDSRSGKTKSGKLNLYMYAIIVSSEPILKLPPHGV